MKRSEIDELMETGADRRLILCSQKGADYSNEKDALLNFKQINLMMQLLDVDPAERVADTAMYFILHKIQRLCNIRGKEPTCESVTDTIDDLHNYVDLYLALLIDDSKAVAVAENIVMHYGKEDEDHE